MSSPEVTKGVRVLEARHVTAISMLSAGEPIEDVARECGVTVRQVYRWRTWPVFMTALAEAQRYGLEAAKMRIAAMRERALDVLEATINDRDVPHQVRVKAAEAVLDRAGMAAKQPDAPSTAFDQTDALDAAREFARQYPEEVARALAEVKP